MFRNIEAEQARKKLTNGDVAEYLGISRGSYERKKKNGYFTTIEAKLLIRLFDRPFEYLFETDAEREAANVQVNQAPV